MVFNSASFLAFFAVVLAVHNLPVAWTLRKAHLLLASYLFYAAWNPPFVLLLWTSTLVDWFAARAMHASSGTSARRAWLGLSLAVNLGLLGFFKYGNFLLESFIPLARAAGLDYAPAPLDLVLPVGISFYTFQTLSYSLDVYHRRLRPSRRFLDYALYVTFFPQLVAGPIVRAATFLPQCAEPPRPSSARLGWGFILLVTGLFQKSVLADGLLAPLVDQVYGTPAPGAAAAWIGTLAFSGQIFFDFAGYSTCAIGAAACLGFALPENFRSPYGAVGFSDFWRRWHISLSTWLRDYLYIPMGGNRRGAVRTHLHLAATMLLGGLWHGASWTFVAWGGLHGLFLAGERSLRGTSLATWALWTSGAGRWMLAGFTFLLVTLAWVPFRAETFAHAAGIYAAMAGAAAGTAAPVSPAKLLVAVLLVGLLLLHHNLSRDAGERALLDRLPAWGPSLGVAAMLFLIWVTTGDERAFIYFRF